MNTRLTPTILLTSFLGLVACQDTPAPVPAVNTPPETILELDSPETVGGQRVVLARWQGTDADGTVAGFEWRTTDDRGQVLDDWTWTTDAEHEFAFEAAVVAGKTANDLMQRIEVRAVDNAGAVDASPASARFSPVTLPPEVYIHFPVPTPSLTCRRFPEVITFAWVAGDDSKSRRPEATRYLLLPLESPNGTCLTRGQYETTNPMGSIASDDPRWGPWLPYTDDMQPFEGNQWLQLPRQDLDTRFLFVVQARDEHGALSKDFIWDRDVRHGDVAAGLHPQLLTRDEFLGTHDFIGLNGFQSFDVLEGQPLRIQVQADASEYGGWVDGFRYGWDVVDPDDPNDPGWQPWVEIEDAIELPEFFFTQGAHSLILEIRDNSGTITRAIFQFNGLKVPALASRRDVLLVDDWRNGSTSSGQLLEVVQDGQWLDLLNIVADFGTQDVVDAQSSPDQLTLARALEYRAVVWFTNPNSGSFFRTRLTPPSLSESAYNWLRVYQAYGGNLLLVGPGAGSASVPSGPYIYPLDFNSTASPWLGFGADYSTGQAVSRGQEQYPYRSFCVETLDLARPAVGFLYGEHNLPGVIKRTRLCDSLGRAEPNPDFIQHFPSAEVLVDLQATSVRRNMDSNSIPAVEEVYNWNATSRAINLTPRPCQIPMFLWSSRHREGWQEDCEGEGSALDDAPTAIASLIHADTKPRAGSADFLWGFDPLTFRDQDVAIALRWILGEHWGIPLVTN